MTLLLDENLPPALVQRLRGALAAVHVRDCGLARASDTNVWDYARRHGYLIASKDSDFHQRSLLLGAPPKVIWIRRGNCSTDDVTRILRDAAGTITRFASSEEEALLILD